MPCVKDILEHKGADVVAVSGDQTVAEVAKRMAELNIGSVVITEGEKVVGIFTERDVLNRVVAQMLDISTTVVKNVMTSPVACCRPDTRLAECKRVMTEKRLRRLPVVEDGRLVGIISSRDILARETDDQAHTIQYLHEYLYGRT